MKRGIRLAWDDTRMQAISIERERDSFAEVLPARSTSLQRRATWLQVMLQQRPESPRRGRRRPLVVALGATQMARRKTSPRGLWNAQFGPRSRTNQVVVDSTVRQRKSVRGTLSAPALVVGARRVSSCRSARGGKHIREWLCWTESVELNVQGET